MVSVFNAVVQLPKMQAAKHFMMKCLLNYFLTMNVTRLAGTLTFVVKFHNF